MNIETLLVEKKKVIVQKWIDQVLDSYGSPEFFKKQKDRFANPIGSTVSDGLLKLYSVLAENRDIEEASKPLEDIIKIRAVQDFTPSIAVSFVYLLKKTRVDKAALMAFDFYMDCRERLHKIRVNEVLSGRSALTDGTKCVSAMLKNNQTESADNNQNNRLT
jgi:hypothetical protein